MTTSLLQFHEMNYTGLSTSYTANITPYDTMFGIKFFSKTVGLVRMYALKILSLGTTKRTWRVYQLIPDSLIVPGFRFFNEILQFF